jgi:nucleotide-binding universal stress UspA family protein
MKSLILPVSDEHGLESRLQAALDICRATSGHLTFLHGIPASAYVALDPFGGSYYVAEQHMAAEEASQQKHDMLRKHMAAEDVPWDFNCADGTPDDVLVRYSRLADLAVLSEPPENDRDDLESSLSYYVTATDCPVLAVPQSAKALDCTGKAVIAWNGSSEAAKAMRTAVPLLAIAGAVELVTIGADPEHFPAEAAASYLSRHDISAEVTLRDRSGDIAQAMHNLLLDREADYLVMGAFSHSRFRETLFGGVSQHFIRKSPVPVLMAH